MFNSSILPSYSDIGTASKSFSLPVHIIRRFCSQNELNFV